MVDGVIAVRQGHTLDVDPERLLHPLQLGRIAGQANHRRVEHRQEAGDVLLLVVLGIDGHEDDVHLVRVVPEPLAEQLHARHRRRAHIGTAREAEEDRVGLALERLVGNRLPLGIDQFERTAWSGALRYRAAIPGGIGLARAPRDGHDEPEREDGRKSGTAQQPARAWIRHHLCPPRCAAGAESPAPPMANCTVTVPARAKRSVAGTRSPALRGDFRPISMM